MITQCDSAAGRLVMQLAREEDAGLALSIMQEASTWLFSRGWTQWRWTFTEEGAERIRQRVRDGGVYLACRGEEAMGVIRLLWEDSDIWGPPGADGQAGYVHMLAIRRAVGGQGVGQAMLAWAEEVIAAEGRPFIRLDTADQNPGICGYYERLGFISRGLGVIEGHRLYEKVIHRSA